LAGKVNEPLARLMVATLSSNGWRITSRTRVPNSGISSKNKTPLCASDISLGLGMFTSAYQICVADGMCGERNGRFLMSDVPAGS